MAASGSDTIDDVGATAPPRAVLLTRVRALLRRLAWLLLVVEVIEWVDATSPVWPQRATAAVALLAILAWTLLMKRVITRVPWSLDALVTVAMVVAGWGLGRPGAILAILLGTTLLRAAYGDRRSATAGTAAVLAAYVAVAYIHEGIAGVLDLGVVTVAVALWSFAAVFRLVAEVLARHDLTTVWNACLGNGAAELVLADDPAQVEVAIATVVAELREVSVAAGGGLIAGPPVPDVEVGASVPAIEATDPELADELRQGLQRLLHDAQLTRERIASDVRFRKLAEGSRDGIYLRALDVHDELAYANPAAAAMMSQLRPGAVQPFQVGIEMVHVEDRGRLEQVVARDGYLSEPVRFRVDRGEGAEVWHEVVEVLASVDEGGVQLVQGTVRDVTRQLQHETSLTTALAQEQRVAERLRQVDELRSMFLAAVSHELRTPLAGLLGSAQTLARHRARLSEEQSTALAGAVERQGLRLQRLLDDLLDVERLSQGLIVPEREPTPILELVRGVVADQIERAAVTVDEASDDVTVDVDRSQVERIVDNLIRNAVKHTPEGTAITVGVREVADGVVIAVEDDGPGVPDPLREVVFQPFAQGPDAARSASPGTGIGLSLVSKFAELHGGRAWIEEPAAGGARFNVFLSGSLTEAETEGRLGVMQR